jgi:putative MATE family efflux protein
MPEDVEQPPGPPPDGDHPLAHGAAPGAEAVAPPPSAPEDQRPVMGRVDLTRGSLLRGIVFLSWPIVAASMLNWLMGVADIKMVGYLGPDAIAAVGSSRGAIFTFMAIIFAISTGTQVLVARYVGEGSHDRVANVLRQAIICSVIFGVLLVPFGMWLSGPLLAALGARESVLEAGTAYMQVYFWGSVALLLNFMINSALRGAGDALTPLLLLFGINVAHVVLEWALIFGVGPFPEMGVVGAAWAVVVSRGAGALGMLWIIFSGRFAVTVPLRVHWRLDLPTWGKMFYIGIPSSIQGFTRNLAYLLVLKILFLTQAGVYAVSGYIICGQIQMVGTMTGLALMSVAMTAVGQNLGARDPRRAESSGWTVAAVSALTGALIAACFVIFGRHLIGFFTDDPQALHWGFVSLAILSTVLPFTTVGMAFSGSLRGAGDTLSPLWVSLISTSGLGPGLAYVLAVVLDLGPTGAWYGLAIGIIAQVFMVGAIFKRGKWKKIRL